MSRRGWLLLGAMAVIWGIPYLLISIAVESLAPAAVVAGRTGLAALILVPIAVHRRSWAPALAQWRWVAVFAAIEMAGPFMLLSHAEQTLPSGITGLLVATVPLSGAIVGFVLGDRDSLTTTRVVGLLVGLAGVAIIVTGSSSDGTVELFNVAEVLMVAVLYSIAPFVVHRKLGDVPGLGTAALALTMVAVAYLPIALLTQDGTPTNRSLGALVALAVVCTALGMVLFFALIGEAGPARATVFTYLNPVVALSLGALVADEELTLTLLIGFPIVLVGCWMAASHRDDEPMLVAEP